MTPDHKPVVKRYTIKVAVIGGCFSWILLGIIFWWIKTLAQLF